MFRVFTHDDISQSVGSDLAVGHLKYRLFWDATELYHMDMSTLKTSTCDAEHTLETDVLETVFKLVQAYHFSSRYY